MRYPNLLPLASALILAAALPTPNSLAQSPTQPPTVSVYIREVTLDVNVTDASGNPVHGLAQTDFTVTENGQPMTARSFREHAPDAVATAPSAVDQLPRNTFTNAGPAEGVHPLFILLFDSLDTPVVTQAIVRRRMADFAQKLPPSTHVAVMAITPTGQLTVVQGFTTDPGLVKKALASHKLDLGIPPLEDFGQEVGDTSAPEIEGDKKVAKAMADAAPKVDQDVECNHAGMRVQYTSNAFALIARYTSGMPGRKNLIWYSGAFPSRMNTKQGDPCYDSREDMSSADDLLDRSHVVVYPIDPRALDIYAKEGPDSRIGRIMTLEHLTMEAIAEQTGGKALYNNNDLAAEALQAITAGLSYYSFTYAPKNQNWDTRVRRLNVAIDQPNLTLVYRRGYSAMPPGRSTTPGGRPFQKTTPVQSAMMRGTLQPTEVLFHVSITPAAATETALPPGNSPDPKLMKSPYRRLTVTYNVNATTLDFNQSPDGAYHPQFEYAVNVYDNDGRLVNSGTLAAKPTLPPTAYQSMLANGIKLHQDIDVPAKGDYILRIGVHDLTTDHVGAIEIPTTSITP